MSGQLPADDLPPWKVLHSETLVDSDWLKVRRERVRTAQGHEIAEYYLLDTADFVLVLALTVDRQVVLVRQYRHGVGRTVLEVPAGLIDRADPSPAAAAERELLEETGYRPGRLESLGPIHPSVARQSTTAHCFLALDCAWQAEPHGDPAEHIVLELMPLGEIRSAVNRGQIPGAPTLACLWLGLERLKKLGLAEDA